MSLRRGSGKYEPLPHAELVAGIAVVALERLVSYMENAGGSEWEREKALRALSEWSQIQEAQAANLPHVIGDLLAAANSGASAQAAHSTIFLLTKIETLIESLEKAREDIADLKMIVRDNREQLTELRQEIAELREERREAGDHLQEQITELKERTR